MMRPEVPLPTGADIDAVEVLDSEDRVIGVADSVIDSRINDPYEANIQAEPSPHLGVLTDGLFPGYPRRLCSSLTDH